jgi:PAS domain S-box-containing protein
MTGSSIMKRKSNANATSADLRRRAEVRLRAHTPVKAGHQTMADAKRLLHELQVHQVELEMQNAALSQAHAEAEANADKFSDLYDFAPVGYFTFAERGVILGANLTGTTLLGVERRGLLGRRFPLWVAPESRSCLDAFLKRTFGSSARQTCEVNLLRSGKANLPVQIEGQRVLSPDADGQCRAVVMDLTERKRAEDQIRKLNTELEGRVAERTAEISALLEQSRHMQEQLRHLSHLVLRAQEEERKRISHELHDQVAQTLVGINLELIALALEAGSKTAVFKKRFARTQRLVEDSVNTLHRFTSELRPPVLDHFGLVPALNAYLKDWAKQTGSRVTVTASAGLEPLNNAGRTVLYRVTQAALSNVARHAKASRVKVRIQKRRGAVRLEIEDNGKGFRVEADSLAERHKRLGLLGMKERLEMVGGNFAVDSVPGRGTTIRAEIPLGNGDGDGQTP